MLHRSVYYSSAAVAGVSLYLTSSKSIKKQITYCSSDYNKNSAFVFIKPHANTSETQKLVKNVLAKKNIKVLAEGELTAEKIDSDKLIDQHYYAIGSFTIYPIPVEYL